MRESEVRKTENIFPIQMMPLKQKKNLIVSQNCFFLGFCFSSMWNQCLSTNIGKWLTDSSPSNSSSCTHTHTQIHNKPQHVINAKLDSCSLRYANMMQTHYQPAKHKHKHKQQGLFPFSLAPRWVARVLNIYPPSFYSLHAAAASRLCRCFYLPLSLPS